MNENGMYAAVKDSTGVRAVFIEEETLEHNRLNAITEQRRRTAEQKNANDMISAQRNRKEQARARVAFRMKRATLQLIKHELIALAGVAIVVFGMSAGYISAVWAIPVLVFFQAVIVFKAGKYFGRYFRRRTK